MSVRHADASSVLTWLRCLKGRKAWYINASLADKGSADLRRAREQPLTNATGDTYPWTRVHLGPADTLVMLPKIEDAVYTPEDRLGVEEFCLPQRFIPTSILVNELLLDAPRLTHDNPPIHLYRAYERYLAHPVSDDFSWNQQLLAGMESLVNRLFDENGLLRDRTRSKASSEVIGTFLKERLRFAKACKRTWIPAVQKRCGG